MEDDEWRALSFGLAGTQEDTSVSRAVKRALLVRRVVISTPRRDRPSRGWHGEGKQVGQARPGCCVVRERQAIRRVRFPATMDSALARAAGLPRALEAAAHATSLRRMRLMQ